MFTEDSRYSEWLEDVAAILLSSVGLPSDDFPDAEWKNMYDMGHTPETAAMVVVSGANYNITFDGEDDNGEEDVENYCPDVDGPDGRW